MLFNSSGHIDMYTIDFGRCKNININTFNIQYYYLYINYIVSPISPLYPSIKLIYLCLFFIEVPTISTYGNSNWMAFFISKTYRMNEKLFNAIKFFQTTIFFNHINLSVQLTKFGLNSVTIIYIDNKYK